MTKAQLTGFANIEIDLTEQSDSYRFIGAYKRVIKAGCKIKKRIVLPPVELLRRSLIQRIAGRLPAPYREGFETRFAEEIQARAPTPRELGLRGPARPPLFEELGLDFEALDPLYRRVVAP